MPQPKKATTKEPLLVAPQGTKAIPKESVVAAPYFDSQQVVATRKYVAWLDGLGTKSALLVSHARAANFVMKIHIASLDALKGMKSITLFPMNDGVYVITADRGELRAFLQNTMRRLAETFLATPDPEKRFMVRGAVSFGFVSSGTELAGGSEVLTANSEHVRGIVLGMPLAQAHEAERIAPPFGIVIHESARHTEIDEKSPWGTAVWRWWAYTKGMDKKRFAKSMMAALERHLAWTQTNPIASGYPADAIERHRRGAKEYFDGELPVGNDET